MFVGIKSSDIVMSKLLMSSNVKKMSLMTTCKNSNTNVSRTRSKIGIYNYTTSLIQKRYHQTDVEKDTLGLPITVSTTSTTATTSTTSTTSTTTISKFSEILKVGKFLGVVTLSGACAILFDVIIINMHVNNIFATCVLGGPIIGTLYYTYMLSNAITDDMRSKYSIRTQIFLGCMLFQLIAVCAILYILVADNYNNYKKNYRGDGNKIVNALTEENY